jgi:Skp family chaperone for outer membrane proteins
MDGRQRPRRPRGPEGPFRKQGVHPVKRSLAGFAIAAMVALVSVPTLAQVPGQGQIPGAPVRAASPSATPASHVAVIDIGYIFKNHGRFKAEMDKMKDQVLAAENGLKAERDRINGLMEKLKGFNPGTPEYRQLEGEVAKAQGDFSVNAQLAKKDFMDREGKVYLAVYSEIERAVAQFSKENGIAVVHRFDGEPVDGADRNRILGSITKPIVYYDPQIDITPDILKMLNGAGVAAAPQAAPRPIR